MWVLVTFFAAGFQTARTAAQQKLRALLSVNGAGFVRYAFGAPVAVAAVVVIALSGRALPSPPLRFWPMIAAAGVAQIFGTNALIRSFSLRSYAVGTVYSKTEVVQIGVFSAVLLGESLHLLGWVSCLVVMAGVVGLAQKGPISVGSLVRGATDPGARLGIFAWAMFGAAAVGIRAASRTLGDHPAVIRAIVTLAVMNTIQTVLQGAFLMAKERSQFVAAFRHWRSSSVVGVLSVLGSAGWATAMTLQNAARVRTVGQVELLFTFAVSHWWLGEKHVRRDYWSSALVAIGVIGVMVFG